LCLSPGNTCFCYGLSRHQRHNGVGKLKSIKNLNKPFDNFFFWIPTFVLSLSFLRAIFFVLDCAFCLLLFNTQHRHLWHRGFLFSVLYPYFFVLILLAFTFCSCCTYSTQHKQPCLRRDSKRQPLASDLRQTLALGHSATFFVFTCTLFEFNPYLCICLDFRASCLLPLLTTQNNTNIPAGFKPAIPQRMPQTARIPGRVLQGYTGAGRIKWTKNRNDLIGNRTPDLRKL
jgi:hypothetical protein